MKLKSYIASAAASVWMLCKSVTAKLSTKAPGLFGAVKDAETLLRKAMLTAAVVLTSDGSQQVAITAAETAVMGYVPNPVVRILIYRAIESMVPVQAAQINAMADECLSGPSILEWQQSSDTFNALINEKAAELHKTADDAEIFEEA